MSWVCMEGWDGLASYSEIGLRSWRSVGAGVKLTTTGGRRNSACVYDDTSGSTTARGVEYGGDFFRTAPVLLTGSTTSDFEIGFAFKVTGTGWDSATSGFTYPLLDFRTLIAEIARLDLYYDGADWYLRHMYGATARVSALFPGGGGDGTRPVSGQWYYVTWLVSGYETGTTATKYNYIAVDGILKGSFSGTSANASNSGSAYLIRLFTGNGVSCNLPSGDAVYIDDVIMTSGIAELPLATAGTTWGASTYIGPCRIDKVVGTEDNPTFDDEFVPSSGADEYPMLDDSTQDGDTTYVSSSTIGHTAQSGYNASVDPLPHVPGTIWGVKGQAVVRNSSTGTAVVRCDLAYNTARSAFTGITYSLPASGSYVGLHSFKSPGVSSADGDYHGSYNGTTTKWVATGTGVGSIRYATCLVEYVS